LHELLFLKGQRYKNYRETLQEANKSYCWLRAAYKINWGALPVLAFDE